MFDTVSQRVKLSVGLQTVLMFRWYNIERKIAETPGRERMSNNFRIPPTAETSVTAEKPTTK
jgi:hypothetical protein